jgi:hypothetical protein
MAAALDRVYQGPDERPIFKDRRYVPNLLVYRMVLQVPHKRGLVQLLRTVRRGVFLDERFSAYQTISF